jgi:hypothetical protein
MLAGTTTDNRLEHGRGCRAGVRSEKYAMPNLKTVAVANILGMAVGKPRTGDSASASKTIQSCAQ